jgi:hypothetical protein
MKSCISYQAAAITQRHPLASGSKRWQHQLAIGGDNQPQANRNENNRRIRNQYQ